MPFATKTPEEIKALWDYAFELRKQAEQARDAAINTPDDKPWGKAQQRKLFRQLSRKAAEIEMQAAREEQLKKWMS